MSANNNVNILGAGLAGSLLATTLSQNGQNVDVYEKRSDPRENISDVGRSINLALSHRGIRALEFARVMEDVRPLLIPMHGRMIHDLQGNTTFQSYGNQNQYINSVSRADLNRILIEKAEKAGAKFHFDSKCESIDDDNGSFRIANKNEDIKSAILVGADGAFSMLRKSIQGRDRFNFSQFYLDHGYKELEMPPVNGVHALEKNYLHIWPRGDFMLIALPNPNGTFTCTLFLSFLRFEQIGNNPKSFFEEHFQDVPTLIPDLQSQWNSNPTSSLVTIKCGPWNRNNTLLIGDAAHAIVPFYGQGMNAAFEDCRILMEMLKASGMDWGTVLDEFYVRRKPDTDAISELAMRNFLEMRDHVGDKAFLERKEADAELHDKYGEKWIPTYSMVTFTDIPYSQALAQSNLQESILINAQKQGNLNDYERILNELISSQA